MASGTLTTAEPNSPWIKIGDIGTTISIADTSGATVTIFEKIHGKEVEADNGGVPMPITARDSAYYYLGGKTIQLRGTTVTSGVNWEVTNGIEA